MYKIVYLCLISVIYFAVGYNSDCILKSHTVVRNNMSYIVFEKMKFDITINKARINLDNLFNGDPILGMFKFLFHMILFYFKKFIEIMMQFKYFIITIDFF